MCKVFSGIVTNVLPIKSGKTANGKEWRSQDVVLVYDNSKPEFPKSIVITIMNENIEKFNIQMGGSYDVKVDFTTREHEGKFYLTSRCWEVTPSKAA